jgi:hypothetical protein
MNPRAMKSLFSTGKESNFGTWQFFIILAEPARLDTGLFVPRRLVCLFSSFVLYLVYMSMFFCFASLHLHFTVLWEVPCVEGRACAVFSSSFRFASSLLLLLGLDGLIPLPAPCWLALPSNSSARGWDRVSRASFSIFTPS